MSPHATPSGVVSNASGCQSIDATVPQLVGEVFEAAPAVERGHLLEQLLRPLGVLSLVAVADGVFAKLRFRGGWQDFHVRLEDVQSIRTSDVISLVDYVQQVSVEVVDGLAQTSRRHRCLPDRPRRCCSSRCCCNATGPVAHAAARPHRGSA